MIDKTTFDIYLDKKSFETYFDKTTFDIYFASIVSMSICHPGAGTRSHKKPSLEDCAKLALEMLEVRNLITEEIPWDGATQ